MLRCGFCMWQKTAVETDITIQSNRNIIWITGNCTIVVFGLLVMAEIDVFVLSSQTQLGRLSFDLSGTALQCKHAIELQFGVPWEIQRLFFDSAILADDTSLCDAGIKPGDTIQIWEPGEIELKTIIGLSFYVWVEPSYSINTLRRIVEKELGYESENVRFIFAGRDVWDYERSLAGWGIHTGARVFMVFRLRRRPCEHCNLNGEFDVKI